MRRLVAFDLETEMIPERSRIFSQGGKPSFTSPYVTPRPVIASVAFDGRRGHVWDIGELYLQFATWVHEGYHILGQNHASFDLDVLWTHGPPALRPIIIEALDRGLIIDTKILDWLVRLAEGEFDMPVYDPHTKKWSVPQARVRSLDKLALEWCNIQLNKDPRVRCGYAAFIDEPSPKAALPEEFRIYAEEDARATYLVGQALLERADSIDPQPRDGALFGPLSCALQARASFIAHQMDKHGVDVDSTRAQELKDRFSQDERPLQDRLVEFGLGKWKPVPKSPREVEDNLPLNTKDITTWTTT